MSKERSEMDLRIPTTRLPRRRGLLVVLATAVALLSSVFAASAQAFVADFALEGSGTSLSNNLAGAHADWTTEFAINGEPTKDIGGQKQPYAGLRDVVNELPPGLLGNPEAFPKCTIGVFLQQVEAATVPSTPYCPQDSQIGTVEPGLWGLVTAGEYHAPLFNLQAPGGNSRIVARLGFYGFFYPLLIDIKLDPKREDALTATLVNVPSVANVVSSKTTLWGVPTDESHDPLRYTWLDALTGGIPHHSGLQPTAFMSNPTSCGPAGVGTGARSYQQIEGSDYAFDALPDIVDCGAVPFAPTMSLKPTTRSAGAASGLDVSLQIPQPGLKDPDGRVASHLKQAVVTLPEEVSLNASAAAGLGSCTEQQIGVDRSERQIVDLRAYGAPVALSFGGQTSPELPMFATAAQVQGALEALPNIAPGDIAVSGRPGGPWTVDFVGSMDGQDEPAIDGIHSELVRLAIKAQGGVYKLGYQGQQTGDLPFDADAAEVKAALEGLPGIGAGNVEVFGGRTQNGVDYRLVFTGALTGTDVSEFAATEGELELVNDDSGELGPRFALVENLAEGGSSVNTHTVKQGGTLGFDDADPNCPESAKIADGELSSPVLDEHMSVAFYLAKQSDNPFGSLFAGYLVAEGAGVMIKVPAKIDIDPATGQVVTTFTNNPQQPFNDLELHFKGGNRSIFTTPDQCGTYTSSYALTPWSGTAPVHGASSFTLDENCGNKGFAPGFHAGSTNPLGGAFTSFVTQVTRDPGTPALTGVSVDLPPGVTAKLAGIPFCPDAALAAVPAGPGSAAAQIAASSCSAASQVGTVVAGTGSGAPFYVRTGKVYLAGPYKGAPLSMAVITPALAGPFDLGNVLVRVAVNLDPATAQVHAVSDPVPTMLQGVPLDIQDLQVVLDREAFVLNPTNCEPEAATGVLTGAGGASANVSDRFQVGECGALGFKPLLKLRLTGGTTRAKHPALTAILRPRAGDANISRVSVALPSSEFLDQAHIGTVCTRVQFAADQCPAASIYGEVTATTPLLDKPLNGNVYLRSSNHQLPDLVLDLRGSAEQPIKLEAAARIDSVHGGLRTTFEFVPDAPLTRVVLKMRGGRKGLLRNSQNLCADVFKATANYAAHNGLELQSRPKLQVRCHGRRAGKHHNRHHHG